MMRWHKRSVNCSRGRLPLGLYYAGRQPRPSGSQRGWEEHARVK